MVCRSGLNVLERSFHAEVEAPISGCVAQRLGIVHVYQGFVLC